MEVLLERLVPNFVLLILALSFTTVTQGKLKYANASDGTKISAVSHGSLFHWIRETLACKRRRVSTWCFTSRWLKQEAKNPRGSSRRGNYKLHRKDIEVLWKSMFLLRRTMELRNMSDKLTSVFYASVLLLIINCVITLSKSRRRVVPQ